MIPEWAGEYLGIPFEDHGRDWLGCDCFGLVRLVLAERFGIALPALATGYGDTQERETIARLIDANRPLLDFRPVEEPQPGDVILVRQAGQPCHVGVLVAPHMMLHTESGTGSRVEDIRRPHIAPRIEGFYRHATR